MANEMTVTTVVSYAKAGVEVDSTDAVDVTVAGAGYAGGVVLATTTHTALPLGVVATLGLLWIKNLDSTNYVEVGVVVAGTFYPVTRWNYGETFAVRIA